MKGDVSIPPSRDLPPNRLAQRREHLITEITQPPSRWPLPRRGLLALAVAALIVVVGTASAIGGVRAFFLDKGFIGLPPQGATPSTPESELEIFYWGHGDPGDKPGDGPRIMAWVYADGRLISLRHGSDLPESANPLSTGFLEQRLTPEGVELLRSEVASTGLFDHDRVLVTNGAAESPRFVDVRNGDRLVHVGAVAECANPDAPCLLPIPGATNATPEQANALYRLNARLSDPASWLPESAWADRDIRAYVSSKYAVCYGGWPPDQQVERSRVLALLPAAARDLFGEDTPLRQGPLFGEPGNFRPSYEYCADMPTEEARAIAVALDDAGLQRQGAYRLKYQIEAQGLPDAASVYFEPYLPHGEIVCSVCG